MLVEIDVLQADHPKESTDPLDDVTVEQVMGSVLVYCIWRSDRDPRGWSLIGRTFVRG